jgi:hypothetical protein
MSAATSAGGSGAVLGLVTVLLAQQLGFVPLSDFGTSALLLGAAAGLGGVLAGAAAWFAHRR